LPATVRVPLGSWPLGFAEIHDRLGPTDKSVNLPTSVPGAPVIAKLPHYPHPRTVARSRARPPDAQDSAPGTRQNCRDGSVGGGLFRRSKLHAALLEDAAGAMRAARSFTGIPRQGSEGGHGDGSCRCQGRGPRPQISFEQLELLQCYPRVSATPMAIHGVGMGPAQLREPPVECAPGKRPARGAQPLAHLVEGEDISSREGIHFDV